MGVRQGFFSSTGRDRPECDRGSADGFPIPEEWTIDYWLGRPIWNRYCTWNQLSDGSLSLKDLMEMHRNINLKDWLEYQSVEIARGSHGKDNH